MRPIEKTHARVSRRAILCSSTFVRDELRFRRSSIIIAEANLNMQTVVLRVEQDANIDGLALFAATVDVFDQPEFIIQCLVEFKRRSLHRENTIIVACDRSDQRQTLLRQMAPTEFLIHAPSLPSDPNRKKVAFMLGEKISGKKKFVLLDVLLGEIEEEFVHRALKK